MKDENQNVLLEALASDVAKIQRELATLPQLTSNIQKSISELNGLIETGKLRQSDSLYTEEDNAIKIAQQMIVDLKVQLDRISLKMKKEDNVLNYYLTPWATLLQTSLFIIIALMIGAFCGAIFMNKHNNREVIKTESNGNF
jgi:hypothetical protein